MIRLRPSVPRPTTRILAVFALLAALGLSACGNAGRQHRVGETEGIYVELGDFKYQVQISRQLNPADVEDEAYLRGLPAGVTPPTAEESWFGVFIRAENTGDEEQLPAETFEIVDTDEQVYRPVLLNDRANSFAYVPRPVAPSGLIPDPDSAAGAGPIQGALLLYKLRIDTFQNRPLELKIRSSQESGEAVVNLDV